MAFGKRPQTPHPSSEAVQSLKKNLTKQKRGDTRHTTEATATTLREPIPPPPPPPSRAEHLRPSSPSLVHSTSPCIAAGRPSTTSLIHGFPTSRQPTSFVIGPPWATPPVDRLMCALDARDLGIPEIIHRLKVQFPALAECVITLKMVDNRVQLLDQRVDIDYFKYGIGLGSRSIEDGVGYTRGARHGAAIHTSHEREKSDTPQPHGKSPLNVVRPKTSSSSLAAKRSQASLRPSRGAKHGLAIHEEISEEAEAVKEQAATRGTAGPVSSSVESSRAGVANHGKLIHHERKPTITGGVAAPFGNAAGSSVRRGTSDGANHGRAIHHQRELSEISGTTFAIDGEPSTTLSIRRPAEKVVQLKTNYDLAPGSADEDTQDSVASTMPLISVTAPLSDITNSRAAGRAAKLGLAIHTGPVKDPVSKTSGKLHVTNGIDKENMSSPSSPSSPMILSLPPSTPFMESTPFEYRNKPDARVDTSTDGVNHENSKRAPGGLGNTFHDAAPLEIRRKKVGKLENDKDKRQWVRESVEMKPINAGAPKFSAESWVREEIITGGLRDERIV